MLIDQQYHHQNLIVSKAKAKVNGNTGIVVKTEHTERISDRKINDVKTNLSETKNSLEAIDLEYIFEVLKEFINSFILIFFIKLAKMPKLIEIQYIEYNETLVFI